LCQFLPQSYVKFAKDGDGDGKIDLFEFPDAIISTGNYLQSHGYEEDIGQAIWHYNHSRFYVGAVLRYANAFRTEFQRTPLRSNKYSENPN